MRLCGSVCVSLLPLLAVLSSSPYVVGADIPDLVDRIKSLSVRDRAVVLRASGLLQQSATLFPWDVHTGGGAVSVGACTHSVHRHVLLPLNDSQVLLQLSESGGAAAKTAADKQQPPEEQFSCSCQRYKCDCDKGCQCKLLGETPLQRRRGDVRKQTRAADWMAAQTMAYNFKCGCAFDTAESDKAFDSMDCSCSTGKCTCSRICSCDGPKGSGFRFEERVDGAGVAQRNRVPAPPTHGVVEHPPPRRSRSTRGGRQQVLGPNR